MVVEQLRYPVRIREGFVIFLVSSPLNIRRAAMIYYLSSIMWVLYLKRNNFL